MLLGCWNPLRKFQYRLVEGVLLFLGVGYLLRLDRHLLQQKLGRHQMVAQAELHVGGHLIEHPWQLVQPGNIVLIILHRLERHLPGHGSVVQVHAIHLVNRHLPVIELRALHGLTQVAHHELPIEHLLFGESRGVDRLEDFELLFCILHLFGNRLG